MKLENEFTVPAALEHAWSVLLDVERVAPCLPGASVEPGGEDGEYAGTMTIKIGPITSRYRGTVKIESADEEAGVAVMRAQAKDARGQGTASATITSSMHQVPDGTRVRVETDLRVTGPAAQFGRGVMQDVSAKLMRQFADCLASEMSAAPTGVNGAAPETGPEIEPEPEPTAAQAPAPEPTAPTNGGPQEPPRRAPEVLDLGEASREAVLKRAVPVVGALVALLILIRLIRR
jgi:carbon monoxide dehydrogenase subunit G